MKRFNISLLFFLAITVSAVAQDKLTPELLWKFERVGSPVASPDGKFVLYTASKYDLQANKGNTDIYRLDVKSGEIKKLTDFEGGDFSPRWTADGKKVGYLSTDGGSVQLWEMNADGSGKTKVSNVEGGISNFSYAPSMNYIMYTRKVKLDKTVQDKYPDLPKANARIIDDLMYRHWDDWDDYKYSHIFYHAYNNGKLTGEGIDIMKGERFDAPLEPFGGAGELAFSPDGKFIAYTAKKLSGRNYAESTNSEIYLYEIASGTTKNLTEGMEGYDKHPVWSPDGSKLVWLSMATPGFESDRNRLFIYDFKTKKKEELTVGFDYWADDPVFTKDGKTIYFNSTINATNQIFKLDVASKKITQLTDGVHNYYGFDIAGNEIIASRGSMSLPTDLYRVNLKDGKSSQITFVNKPLLDNIKMGKVEKRMIKSTDGKEVLTWVIYPPNFDPNKKYPTLLYCQGGPQSAVSQFFSYRWNFQLMAANDYIIVAPNRRGLPGFGQEWNDQISGDWGGQAMQDLFAAIDEVAKEPFVDNDRLGAIGASFGGYTVYWMAGNHDKRFKAFISHCGLFNLESWYATTEEMFFANQDIGGPYWDKKYEKAYEKFSPHKFVGKWDTPILVIHGEKDFRVPIGEGIQAFNAAQLQNIPSRFLYYPEEGHWVLQPQNGVLWHREFFEWLDKWLKD